jgi:hypothetical protein
MDDIQEIFSFVLEHPNHSLQARIFEAKADEQLARSWVACRKNHFKIAACLLFIFRAIGGVNKSSLETLAFAARDLL